MALGQERTPRERETLIFRQGHEAQEFAERVEARARQQSGSGVKRSREVVAEEVAAEFERHGETAGMLSVPWEHLPEEHNEAQQLVDVAFAEDIAVALKRARQSKYYPRNIDLLHDVLTGQLYELLVKRGLNRPSWRGRLLYLVGGAVVLVVIIVFIIVLS